MQNSTGNVIPTQVAPDGVEIQLPEGLDLVLVLRGGTLRWEQRRHGREIRKQDAAAPFAIPAVKRVVQGPQVPRSPQIYLELQAKCCGRSTCQYSPPPRPFLAGAALAQHHYLNQYH